MTISKTEVRFSTTVNLALLAALLGLIVKGAQWVEQVDARFANIENALTNGSLDRWTGSDTVIYHRLAQATVDAWANENQLTAIQLPDPKELLK